MILDTNTLSDILDSGDVIHIMDEVQLLDMLCDFKEIFTSKDMLGLDEIVTNLTVKGHLVIDDTIHLDEYILILKCLYPNEIIDLTN
tara:strand:- start:263 stop:523 length:261 start_codon:yes stop_codon:yes gene_type:complete